MIYLKSQISKVEITAIRKFIEFIEFIEFLELRVPQSFTSKVKIKVEPKRKKFLVLSCSFDF